MSFTGVHELRRNLGSSRFVKNRLGMLVLQPQAHATMKSPSAQPIGYLLTYAAELRAMATTASHTSTAAALVRLAKRLEAVATKQPELTEDAGGTYRC